MGYDSNKEELFRGVIPPRRGPRRGALSNFGGMKEYFEFEIKKACRDRGKSGGVRG